MGRHWVSIREASRISGYSKSSIRSIARKGGIPSKKGPRGWLLDRDEAEKLSWPTVGAIQKELGIAHATIKGHLLAVFEYEPPLISGRYRIDPKVYKNAIVYFRHRERKERIPIEGMMRARDISKVLGLSIRQTSNHVACMNYIVVNGVRYVETKEVLRYAREYALISRAKGWRGRVKDRCDLCTANLSKINTNKKGVMSNGAICVHCVKNYCDKISRSK